MKPKGKTFDNDKGIFFLQQGKTDCHKNLKLRSSGT